MKDINKRLDEIASHKIWLAINGVERKIDMYNELFVIIPQDILVERHRELKQAIKQLIVDEFEKVKIEQTELIRDRFVRDGWEYKWLTERIDELRQKLEELKK